MTTHAITADYHGEMKDAADKFGGAIVVYIGWDQHLMFPAPKAFPLDPNMPFAAVIEHVFPEGFGQHPEFSQIDWSTVEWHLNQEPFTPVMDKSLAEQGFDHKSMLRFRTPTLTGYKGAGI